MAYSSSEDMKNTATRAGNDLSRAVNDASDKASDALSNVQNKAMENFDKVESAIRRNPLAAASIAGGVGFVLAVLARR